MEEQLACETVKPLILVAEDDAMAGELVRDVLEMWGFDTNLARNGEDAVDLWEQRHYDLILMDIQMPKLDGISATSLIRQKEKERGGHTPIVAFTAFAFGKDRERCLAAGMDAYLTKPLDFSEGKRVITALIGRSGTS
ncbi:Response regulator receiver domain-containing protein [Geobacter sp. DSM 9736]|nr:Response regulator receiver domain-containing protein [Geobacter sp. DSM 9736]